MALKLSVLIATMPSRNIQFRNLLSSILSQFFHQEQIEIISDDSMSYNIGVKRNNLLKRAAGEYVVFIDDDDLISDKYVEYVLAACNSGSDCIGINGTMTTNGGNLQKWIISKEFGKTWFTKDNIHYRCPNHISPVKRELALKAGFPPIRHGEDADYSSRLFDLLKTETIIEHPIYHYDYWTKK